jgi:hypothetical protein
MKIERTTKKYHLNVVVDVPTPTVEIPKRFKARLLHRFTPTDKDIEANEIKVPCPLCRKFNTRSGECLPECPFRKIKISMSMPSTAPCLPWLRGMKSKWMVRRIHFWDDVVEIESKKNDPTKPGTKAYEAWTKRVKREFELFRNRVLKHIRWV